MSWQFGTPRSWETRFPVRHPDQETGGGPANGARPLWLLRYARGRPDCR